MSRWLCLQGECVRTTSVTRIDFHDGCAYLYVGEAVTRDSADVVVADAHDIGRLRALVGEGDRMPWFRLRDAADEGDTSAKYGNVEAVDRIRILPTHTGNQAMLLTRSGRQVGAVHEPKALRALLVELGINDIDLDAFAIRELVTIEEVPKTVRS